MTFAWNIYQHLANEKNLNVVHELSSQPGWIIFVWNRIQERCDFGTKQERAKNLKINHLQIYIFSISPQLILSQTPSNMKSSPVLSPYGGIFGLFETSERYVNDKMLKT